MPFYTGPYGCYAPLRSSIGVGPRGDGVTANVVTGDDGSCVIQIINTATGEVIETTPDLAFTFDDFTEEQLEALRADVATVYYRKDDAVVRTSGTNTTIIQIPFDDYRDTDMLFVSIEGLSILQGTDYAISNGNIVLSSPIVHDDTAVEFTRMTSMAFSGEGLDDLIDARIEAGINSWLDEHPEAIGDAIAQTAAEAKSIAESAESRATYAESVATNANDTASTASQDFNSFKSRFPADISARNISTNEDVTAWFSCINGVAYLDIVGTVRYLGGEEDGANICVIPQGYMPGMPMEVGSYLTVPLHAEGIRAGSLDFTAGECPSLSIRYDGVVSTNNRGVVIDGINTGGGVVISTFLSWPVQA